MPVKDPIQGAGVKSRLKQLIDTWEDFEAQTRILKSRIRDAREKGIDVRAETDLYDQLDRVVARREDARDEIIEVVREAPRLRDEAIKWGFKEELLPDTDAGGGGGGGGSQGPASGGGGGTGTQGPPSGTTDAVDEVVSGAQGGNDPTNQGGGGGRGGGGDRPNLRGQAANNRLLGDEGKHYVIRRTPAGGYLAVYSFKVDGQTFKIAVQIPKDELGKYGVKRGDGKLLTKAQLENIENIGWADELAPHVRQGDGHMVKSLQRYLRNQYGGNPMLESDEVMGKVIANSFFGWTPGEFENQLRNTKWYSNTNEYQRTYDTTMSNKERKEIQASTMQKVLNALEDTYGFDWMTKIEGGMQKAKKWAEDIASGKWGTPEQGLAFWAEKQFDKAVGVEGTPAWISRQKEEEATRAYLNRPEDISEQLRQDEIARFGRVITPKKERDAWATDIATEARSEADWERRMRQQMKTLYPYLDENLTFTEQTSPFKAELEQTLGSPVGWDHDLLMDFAATDDKGKTTGSMMTLHDFRKKIRDPDQNPAAYEAGTPLFQQGMDRLQGILGRLKGAA